ncbi:angelicin synthase [Quercus suber]|uniref:Angelicin synthase n=1 Tax=Quercus suber TaxID=58331 RepID=A0AAW0K944_QUESU
MTLISDFLHATLITANELPRILLTLLLLLLVIFTLSCNYAWMKKRTSLLLLPPGPRGVPLFGNLLSLDSELHSYFTSLAQIYGPIFRLQLGNKIGIVVSSPSLACQVLKDHDVIFANHDVSAAGRAASYVEGEEGASLGADFKEVVSLMTELMGKPNISDFYPGLARFDLQGIKRQMDGLAKRFDRIFDVMINQRLKIDKEGGDKEGKDFLQILLKLKDEGDAKTPLTMIHLKALFMISLNPTHLNILVK